MTAQYLGIEIGGTKLQAGVCGQRGGLKQLYRVAVERHRGRNGILAQLAEIVPPLIRQFQPLGIGIGFGGPVDTVAGRVLRSHHVPGWTRFPLRDWARRTFRLPVVIENDAHCAGLAEARCGAGRGKQRVLYFNVGTGIGGALIVDRQIDAGRLGGAELGHTRVAVGDRREILEWVASGLALEQGRCTVAQSADRVGFALANAMTLWNPEIVVAGGGVVLGRPGFLPRVRDVAGRLVFQPYRRGCPIVPARLGEAVVVIGAALLAGDRNRLSTK